MSDDATATAIGRGTQRQADLKSIVEKVEAIRAVKKQCGEDEKVVMAGAKAAGFFPPIVRLMVKMRTLTADELAEYETRRDLYMHAMELGERPESFKVVETLATDELGRAELISQFKGLVPRNGSITLQLAGKGVRIWRDADGNAHHENVAVSEGADDDKVVHIRKPH